MNHGPEHNLEEKPVNKELYFLPILARALSQPDRARALTRALVEIEELGRDDEYRIGHEQFRQFMREALGRRVPEILVEKDGHVIVRIDPARTAGDVIIPRVTPGQYAVRLSTGRLVWTGTLDAADLLWGRAFPGTPLPMAADSGPPQSSCSREERLLGEEVVLRVYPGLESGTLAVEIKACNESRSRS